MRSREFAEILKQKQQLSLVEAGVFRNLGSRDDRVYFVETFDTDSGIMKNLFLREVDDKGRESVVFAKEGTFSLADNKRTLELSNGYRYNGIPGQADFNEVSFKHLSLVISVTPKWSTPSTAAKPSPPPIYSAAANRNIKVNYYGVYRCRFRC